jgi:hypothetical protein
VVDVRQHTVGIDTIYSMVMKEARWGAVSPGVFLVDSSVSRRIPTFRLKNRRIFTLFTICRCGRRGKLGEYSDKLVPRIGNQAESSDKAVNYMTDAASRAEASMQLMEIGIASLIMKNVVLPGIRLALEICPNLGAPVFWPKVRTRGSQPNICVRIFTQFTKTCSHL